MARQEGTVIDYGIPEIDRLQHLIILSITADSHEYGSVEGAEVKVGQGEYRSTVSFPDCNSRSHNTQ